MSILVAILNINRRITSVLTKIAWRPLKSLRSTLLYTGVSLRLLVLFSVHRQKIRQKLECMAKPSVMAIRDRNYFSPSVHGPKFAELSTHVRKYMQFATLEYYVCLVYICIYTFLKIDYITEHYIFIVRLCVCHFLPRDASAERGNEIACRLSVCLSVRLSVCNDQVPCVRVCGR